MKCKSPEIISMLDAFNDAFIARHVGVSRERVRQIREKTGIENPYKNQRCDLTANNEHFVSEIIKLIEEGFFISQIASKLNLEWKQVERLIKLYRLPRPKRGKRQPSKYTREFIFDLYGRYQGNTASMARELGIRQSSVYVACKRYGLKGIGNRSNQGSPTSTGCLHRTRGLREEGFDHA